MKVSGQLHALATLLTGKEPLLMGGPHSGAGYFGKEEDLFIYWESTPRLSSL
jgi:hypothetical protein